MPATAAGTHNYYRTLATVRMAAAETIFLLQTSTAEGRPGTAGTPATVETPATVQASAGTSTATVWSPTTFGEILEKLVRKANFLLNKDTKRVKDAHFKSDKFRSVR
jgi:hypothetical protein